MQTQRLASSRSYKYHWARRTKGRRSVSGAPGPRALDRKPELCRRLSLPKKPHKAEMNEKIYPTVFFLLSTNLRSTDCRNQVLVIQRKETEGQGTEGSAISTHRPSNSILSSQPTDAYT